MQIRRLKIDNHKCLVDFEINFETMDGGSSTILIGENGTGKSTMINAILEILMSFDTDAVAKRIGYNYTIEYIYKGSIISIRHATGRYVISIDGEELYKGVRETVVEKLASDNRRLFPERIVYFYSGQNNLMIPMLYRVDINYRNKGRKLLGTYWNALYLANHTYTGQFPKHKYVYCTEKYVPVYLLAIMCGTDSREKELLKRQCNFSSISSVSIRLSVEKMINRLHNNILETGNEGVCDLISFIDDQFTNIFRNGFSFQDDEIFYYDIAENNTIAADPITIFNFFDKLIYLLDAEIEVSVNLGSATVRCRDLSEGQRQLIKVLGMVGVCKDEDTLVLMDEPDAHMNPRWKYELKSTIDACLADAVNTQAIIATHDPLVINGVDKKFIRIFTQNQAVAQNNNMYITKVVEPNEDTIGMGIDGLLQSEYYGLRTSYDSQADRDFKERQALYIKLINNESTEAEKSRLVELTKKIGAFHVSNNTIDFLYDDFLSVYRNSKYYLEDYLTPEEIGERKNTVQAIIESLFRGRE